MGSLYYLWLLLNYMWVKGLLYALLVVLQVESSVRLLQLVSEVAHEACDPQ
jgi:hypothetical protein